MATALMKAKDEIAHHDKFISEEDLQPTNL